MRPRRSEPSTAAHTPLTRRCRPAGDAEWARALADFQHAAALGNRPDANLLNDMGVCRYELGDVEEALHDFTAAIERNGSHAPSFSNRANCHKGLQKWAEAEADYSRAIEIDDANPKAFLSRARLRETMGQPQTALEDYARVVALQPRHEPALRKVVELSPDVDAAASHRGWLHKQGHVNTSYQSRYFLLHGAMLSYYESADAVCKGRPKGDPIVARIAHVRPSQVSELSSEKASLAFQFDSIEGKCFIVYAATAEEKLGWLTAIGRAVGGGHGAKRIKVESAYADFLLGGEGGGQSGTPWSMVARGAQLAQSGGADEARLVLEKASAAAGGDASTSGVVVCAQYLLGKLIASKGMHAEATAHLRNAASGAPPTCAQIVQLQLAWSYWHCSKWSEAEETYWDLLDEDVLCWQALVDRARMHLGRAHWVQALCDLAQVAAMGRADADVCNDLGVAHFETGNDEAACDWFSRAIEKAADHAAAISNRANCLRRRGKLREAEEDYTRAIEIDNSNPKPYLNRGLMLRERGYNSRAHRDLERALALDPTNSWLQDELRSLTSLLAEAIGKGGTASSKPPAGVAENEGGNGGSTGTRTSSTSTTSGGSLPLSIHTPLQSDRL